MKKRIDKFILDNNPQLTRTYIKEQIKLGNILINNKRVKPSYEMREGDQVAFAPGFKLQATGEIQPNPDIKLKIIYEDDDVIVIDKPAGLTVHPRQTKTGAPLAKELNNTLVSALLAHYPLLATVGDNPAIRPGIVHRLDKDTSGLMIVAKNQKSFSWLKNQFKERKVQKKYIALISGCPKENQGALKTYLTRSATEPSKQKVVSGTDNIIPRRNEREAITEYKVTQKFRDYCLIEASPKTGRLHQIRVQFAWFGHPVAGDTKYGRKNTPAPLGLKRQFLHAAELKINLPTGGKKTFFSPLPTELAQTIKGLQKN